MSGRTSDRCEAQFGPPPNLCKSGPGHAGPLQAKPDRMEREWAVS